MAGKVFPEDILRAWNTRQRARLSSMFYELRNGKAEGTNERTRERRIELQLIATRTRHTWGRVRGRATPTGLARAEPRLEAET